MEDFKKVLSSNLVALRKSRKLTQSELAESLSYSDKTVSKWENGDAVPDVETLIMLANFYNVSVDDLVSKQYQELTQKTIKEDNQNRWNKTIITLLAVSLVWLTATILYVQVKIISSIDLWMAFIWAVPVSFIVLLVFNSIWGKRFMNFVIISFLVWTILMSVHLQFLNIATLWPIYFLGVPLQIATILWSQLKSSKR